MHRGVGMPYNRRRQHVTITALIGVALLALAANALAAHPKAGKPYAGVTSASKIEGFSPAVTFRVSKSGSELLGFTFQTLGCFGAGGFKPGENPFSGPYGTIKLGTISVTTSGAFAVTGAEYTYKSKGYKVVTKATVNGKFHTAKRATGSVVFGQTETGPHISKPVTCSTANFPLTFTASVK
jgi:hypothetical protein